MKKIIFLIMVFVLLISCSLEEALKKELAKPILYSNYINNDFSIKYPNWPEFLNGGYQ